MPVPALRPHALRITIAAVLVLVAAGLAGAAYYASRYRPLVLGSSWGGLDTRSVELPDGTSKAVVQYDAGRTWSYATSVRNGGHWAVDLTGASIEPEPRVDGARSSCEYPVACLTAAAWSYGPVSRTWKPSDGDRDTWHPFGTFHLEAGDEVMVRLTYVFGRCPHLNEGTAFFEGWQARYSYFGQRRSVVPFAGPLEIQPLPATQQRLVAGCPPAP